MIGTLWLLAQWAALAVVAAGVIFHRWTGWAARPWWYAVAVLTAVNTTWQCLVAGRTTWAASYSVAALIALVGMVLAARRERAQPRHVENWSRWT
ncbi:MAG TPA: hypothetical protein VLL08_23060 [Kineosporiaceae bacterium]|nr:hypothetical protein [Kineosporiaceae bacterium]